MMGLHAGGRRFGPQAGNCNLQHKTLRGAARRHVQLRLDLDVKRK